MEKNCTRCHGGSGPRAGLNVSTYAALMKGSSNGTVVTAGNADKSPLYTLVKSGVMPFGGTKLADADAQKIFDWIQAGALNN
jgi:mono/diheme cytochrome c family protein